MSFLFSSAASHWESVALQYRQKRDKQRDEAYAEIQQLVKQHLPAKRQDELLQLTATAAVDKISRGEITSYELTLLYSWRAIQAGKLLNCNAEEFYIEALETAQQQDTLRQKQRQADGLKAGQPLKNARLLEGLPISVKDQIEQRGAISTCGIASRLREDYRAKEDGALVQVLRDEGAVPFTRTNIPQLLMIPESESAAWGRVNNAWSTERSSGGSSGGEGALLAARGSILGLGSDIGGSLRIPAHANGICAIKCTPARNTIEGMTAPKHGSNQRVIGQKVACGPMARSVNDLTLVLKTWWNDRNQVIHRADPSIPHLPWRDDVYNSTKPLKIGYYIDSEGIFACAPAVRRAILEAVDVLKKRGHFVVEYKPKHLQAMIAAYSKQFTADGLADFWNGLQGEKPLAQYTLMRFVCSLPQTLRLSLATVVGWVGQARLADSMRSVGKISMTQFWDNELAMQQYRNEYHRHIAELGLDAWLCPTLPLPAFLHGSSGDLTASVLTLIQNVLEVPAGAVPVTVVKEDEQTYSDEHNDMLTGFATKACQNSAGLPISVQVCALPFDDEQVARVMREIETDVKFHQRYKPSVLQKIEYA